MLLLLLLLLLTLLHPMMLAFQGKVIQRKGCCRARASLLVLLLQEIQERVHWIAQAAGRRRHV